MSQPFFKRLANEWKLDSIGIGIFIALTALAYVLEIAPAMSDREAARVGNAQLAEKRETVSHLQASIHAASAQIAALDAAQAKELKLQATSAINDRLSALSSLAAEKGLLVEAVEPGEAATATRYSTIPIRINGRGTYPQFVTFIHALRTELPDTSITDLTMSGGGTGPASFTLNLLWYAAPAQSVAKNEMQ
jgi:Tfp pilus assembly protein PilO